MIRKYTKYEYSQLYFCGKEISREIRKNLVLQKFQTMRYALAYTHMHTSVCLHVHMLHITYVYIYIRMYVCTCMHA